MGPKDTVYIADSYNKRIREVNKQGRISTIVGVGVQGFNGDEVPASDIMLSPQASR